MIMRIFTVDWMPMPDPMPPIAIQRQMIGSYQETFGAQLLKRYDVRVEAAVIAGVPVRIIYPKGVNSLGSGPVLLNLHGGGFMLDSGSLTETIPIAGLTGIPVVAVLYRLAPEHPFPAAVDDAQAVYDALLKDHKPSKIAVYGTSAGAGLGAQLLARLTKLGRPMPAALGFFSGSADLTTSGDSESWMPLPNGGTTLAASIAPYIGTTPATDPILVAQRVADRLVPPQQDVQDDSIDAVVSAEVGEHPHRVAPLPVAVDAALALLVAACGSDRSGAGTPPTGTAVPSPSRQGSVCPPAALWREGSPPLEATGSMPSAACQRP